MPNSRLKTRLTVAKPPVRRPAGPQIKKTPSLSVLMPVFNEKATIAACLDRVKKSPLASEIIIVDDGSTDGTRAILAKINDPKIKVILHKQNQGKGAAVVTALREAKSDYVVIQDADLEYDPAEFRKLFEPILEGSSVVVYGSRFLGRDKHTSQIFELGNKFLSLVTSILYGTRLTDMETCYKLMKRQEIKDFQIHSRRFDFEPEITAKILKKGLKIIEIPITYASREFDEGKKITWRDGLVAFWTLFKYRFVD